MESSIWIESVWLDLRYAGRGFWRSPAFSIVAIVTMAVGVGSSTAIFSAIDPILFRPLPYVKDYQLVSLGYFGPLDNTEFNVVSSYIEWRERQTVFQAITSMRPGAPCDIQDGETPRQLTCYGVEANFLRTFGIKPALGRDFMSDEDRPGAPAVILISNALWQGRFGGDPALLGRTVTLDEQPARIIGVLPKDFEMPQLGDGDVLMPARLNTSLPRAVNAGAPLRTFARLRDGTRIEQAREAMRPIFEDTVRQDAPFELRPELRLVVRSLRDRQIEDVKLASWMLLGAVLSLLLVSCANMANLLLARAAGRRRELAMRLAIGAGRTRLIGQMLAESLLLGLPGGAVGCGAAWLLLRAFIRTAPQGLLRLNQAQINGRVLLFALAATALSAVLFGVAPGCRRAGAADGSVPVFEKLLEPGESIVWISARAHGHGVFYLAAAALSPPGRSGRIFSRDRAAAGADSRSRVIRVERLDSAARLDGAAVFEPANRGTSSGSDQRRHGSVSVGYTGIFSGDGNSDSLGTGFYRRRAGRR